MAKTSTATEAGQEGSLREGLEAAIQERVREIIERVLEEEVEAALGARRSRRLRASHRMAQATPASYVSAFAEARRALLSGSAPLHCINQWARPKPIAPTTSPARTSAM